MRALTRSHYVDYTGLVGFSVAGCVARVVGKSLSSGLGMGGEWRNGGGTISQFPRKQIKLATIKRETGPKGSYLCM